jgi:hypothetical protein
MKNLLDFIGFMIVFFLICFIFSGVKIHTINETDATMDYKTKDMVYILPDSIPGMVESGMVFTRRHKDEVTKVKSDETFYQIYTVIYTDKNGVVQKLKNINSELLAKK